MVIDAFEEPEESGPVLVDVNVLIVLVSRDPSHRLHAAEGHEELGFRMGKVGILPRREELKLGEDQWRDPVGVVPVDLPRVRDKFLELPAIPQRNGAYRDREAVQNLNPPKRRPARLAARVPRPCRTSRG